MPPRNVYASYIHGKATGKLVQRFHACLATLPLMNKKLSLYAFWVRSRGIARL